MPVCMPVELILNLKKGICLPHVSSIVKKSVLKLLDLTVYISYLIFTENKKFHSNLRTALFQVITQRVVVISYRRFGTTSLVPSFFLFLDSLTLKIESIECPKTSLVNYHYSLHKNPEECSSHLLRVGSLNSL